VDARVKAIALVQLVGFRVVGRLAGADALERLLETLQARVVHALDVHPFAGRLRRGYSGSAQQCDDCHRSFHGDPSDSGVWSARHFPTHGR
jgi:hypothetical protein